MSTDNSTEQKILKIRSESHILYREKRYLKAVEKMLEAWETLPGNKENATMSNVLAQEIAEMYLEDLKDFPNAIKWGNILKRCYKNKLDSGEAEFLLGKIYFEMNELEHARELFEIALQKSEGLIFEGKDKKYIDLLQKKK